MIKEAIDRLISLGEMKLSEVDGRPYSVGVGKVEPLKPPMAQTLTINTLSGILNFMDNFNGAPDAMIHIADHKTVHVIDAQYVDAWKTRSTHLSAVHESPVFAFGQYYDIETFIIAIQAMFVQDATTAMILKVVGNVKDEGVSNFSDDGVTQKVTAKTGISIVGSVAVPNPVTLRPYRTFMEIEQPASTFVFRMKGGQGEQPKCALFEADGRMWRLVAINTIHGWLASRTSVRIIA